MEPKPTTSHYLDWLQMVREALAEKDPENRETKLQAARLFLSVDPTPATRH